MEQKCECCEVWFTPSTIIDKYCSNKCGNRVRARRWGAEGKEKEKRRSAKYKYHIHKTNATRRGIDFNITFDEWWSVWESHWTEDQHGKLCMCRHNDEGPYEIGNVRIDTWQNNYREARGLPLV